MRDGVQFRVSEIVNKRVLVIDDNESIHQDYRAILCASAVTDDLEDLEQELFEPSDQPVRRFALISDRPEDESPPKKHGIIPV